MATLEYNVDLKAIKEMYPDATNSERVLNIVMDVLEQGYTRIRNRLMKEEEVNHATMRYRGYNENPDPVNEYPTYEDAVVGTYSVAQGSTYNDVVTMIATVSLTVTDPQAVKILNMIDLVSTFYINPTNRLTGY